MRKTKALILSFIVFIVAIVVFFAAQKKPKDFKGDRVVLIDNIGDNYLFRGSNPFVRKNGEIVFAYDELKTYINQELQKQGRKPVDDFYLVDLSLLEIDEHYQLAQEKEFFKSKPENGELIEFSTISLELFFADSYLNLFVNRYNSWLTKQLEEVHNILQNQIGKPVVIYVHCNGGRDRSGFITASYRMLFNDMNLAQVSKKNESEVGRNSEGFYLKAIKSYCLHVEKLQGKQNNFCAA